MAYTLKTKLANKSNYGDARETKNIKYLVVHYTGNDGDTDENNGKYFANNVVKASAHYFVDDDSVTQSVPDDHVAWSVGGSKYADCTKTGGGKYHGKCTNANSINVELCDDVKNGVVYPSAKTIENAIELVKKLMKQYNIPASNVIRHFDVTGKKCPAYWVNDAKWKAEFLDKLSEAKTEAKTETFKSYQIKVANVEKGDVLNIRNTASTKSKVTGTLEYNDPNKYTIVEEKTVGTQKWGKLKSGEGWINLYYTKKVTETETTKTVKKEIKVGSTVKVKKDAKTYQGGGLAPFVYENTYKVKEINIDRVVITKGKTIIAAVRKQDLTVVD